MVSVSTRTDPSHRFLFVTLNVEFTKIDLGYLDGEEAEKLADEFQAISNEIRDFANWSKKQDCDTWSHHPAAYSEAIGRVDK